MLRDGFWGSFHFSFPAYLVRDGCWIVYGVIPPLAPASHKTEKLWCISLGCWDFKCLPTLGCSMKLLGTLTVCLHETTKSYSLLAGEQISQPRPASAFFVSGRGAFALRPHQPPRACGPDAQTCAFTHMRATGLGDVHGVRWTVLFWLVCLLCFFFEMIVFV